MKQPYTQMFDKFKKKVGLFILIKNKMKIQINLVASLCLKNLSAASKL